YMWSRDPKVREWLRQSRLDGFSRIMSEIAPGDTPKQDLIERLRTSMPHAIANAQTLMAM
ncbi:MAG: NAD(P)/FAD-dependent oxidoreductase, partial [Alphaproteobacteria bacterium]|nr:NAD(P)/FAD-dependent oxidoreductase [Alphaproteobacteria bacterium]